MGAVDGRCRTAVDAAQPDCVLLDLNLPDANGIDALQHIRRRAPDTPIVVLTGLNDEHFGHIGGRVGGAGLPGQGPRRTGDAQTGACCTRSSANAPSSPPWNCTPAELRARENARLERGLLPSPLLLDDPGVEIVAQLPAEPRERTARRRLLRLRPDADRHRPRHDRRRRRTRPRRGGARGRAAHRLARAHLRRPARPRPDARAGADSAAPSAPARASSRRC